MRSDHGTALWTSTLGTHAPTARKSASKSWRTSDASTAAAPDFNVSTRRNALMIVYQRECIEVLRGPCDKPQQKQAAPAHDDQLISQAASLKGLPESLEHLTEIVSADVHGEKATYAKRESDILRCFIQRLAGR